MSNNNTTKGSQMEWEPAANIVVDDGKPNCMEIEEKLGIQLALAKAHFEAQRFLLRQTIYAHDWSAMSAMLPVIKKARYEMERADLRVYAVAKGYRLSPQLWDLIGRDNAAQ